MSRKARVPVILPKGVEVKLDGNICTVKGPKGRLQQELMAGMVISIEEGKVTVALEENREEEYRFLGLYWALISNMVKGVSEGFEKNLEMVGVGYRAAVQGKLLDLQLGFSHPVKLPIPEGIQVAVEKNTMIQIKGIDRQLVGQFAADVRAKRPPEPYQGKGIKYVNEAVRRKAGKAGKASGKTS